ncbi:hypothetical protein KL935_001287 [Ogataea polymorpha]|nr:hypothetical protein KL935_001287 [Ogataea polymorpha]
MNYIIGARASAVARAHLRRITTVPMIFEGAPTDHHFISPSPTGKPLHKVLAVKDARVVAQLCERATKGFLLWKAMSVKEKLGIYDNIICQLEALKDELIQAHVEIGNPMYMAEFNYYGTLDNIRHYRSILDTRPAGKMPVQNVSSQSTDEISMVVNEPFGPVLSIAAWNAPLILAARAIFAPLTAGCSVIVKSSDLSARIAHLIVQALLDAGVPKDVLTLVHCESSRSKEIVEALIANRNVKKVNFTGSTRVGSEIAAVAGKHIKPVLLELGGKNCSIILDDVEDLENALRSSLWASWAHKGQICMCTDLIFVSEKKYPQTVKILQKIATETIANDKTLAMPQRTAAHAESGKKLISEALQQGAKLLAGTLDFSATNKFAPVILTDVTPEMKIYTTETFAPVVCLVKYKDVASVADKVNALDHGLKCSIWTSQGLAAYKLAGQIDCGSVHVNRPTVLDEPHLPHGGTNKSGYGRFNSHWGVSEFQYPKLLTIKV